MFLVDFFDSHRADIKQVTQKDIIPGVGGGGKESNGQSKYPCFYYNNGSGSSTL